MGKLHELEIIAKNQGTRLNENETQVFFRFIQQQIEYGRMMHDVYQAFNKTMNILLDNEAQFKTEKTLAIRDARGMGCSCINLLRYLADIVQGDTDDDIQNEWTCQSKPPASRKWPSMY